MLGWPSQFDGPATALKPLDGAFLGFFTKNCFYSDTENKACDDSFVLHIAVNTNVSEGFVFTAISSTNQILCQIATSDVEFQAQEIGPDNFTSRHYRKYQY